VVIGIIVFLGIVSAILGGVDYSAGGGGALAFAIVIGLAGVFLLRRGTPEGASSAAPEDDAASAVAPATASAAPVARRQRRPASPLGWYVLGAALVGLGAMALASGAWAVGLTPGAYAGVTLAVIGAGLLVATFWGHARFLIVIGLLILPIAWAASLVSVPLEGGFASQRFAPASADAIRDEYRLAGGRLVLDLTRVEDDGEPITVDASIAFGELVVLVPDDATVDVDASVGGGRMDILGTPHRGTRLEASELIEGDGPHFILDLQAGIGEIDVDSRTSEGR
jgi:hypothetical protein